jgi:hypothetical protein
MIVRLRHGCDNIYLKTTDLPEGTWPFESESTMSVQFMVARGDGEEYLEKHFPGIPVEVVALD